MTMKGGENLCVSNKGVIDWTWILEVQVAQPSMWVEMGVHIRRDMRYCNYLEVGPDSGFFTIGRNAFIQGH